MARLSAITTFLVFILISMVNAQQGAIIYLKDGNVLSGEIIKKSDLTVHLRDTSGSIRVLFTDEIKRIDEVPLKSNSTGEIPKQQRLVPQVPPELILLKDGTSIRGYVVAQDGNELVVESELGRLTIPKDKVKSVQYDPSSESPRQDQLNLDTPAATPVQISQPTQNAQDRQVIIIQQSSDKSPVLAWALSFFIFPGLGQYYNGDAGKGTVQLVTWVAGVAGLIAASESNSDATAYAGGTLILGSWVWSFVDAPMSAMRMNYENRLKRERISLLPVTNQHIKIGLAFSF